MPLLSGSRGQILQRHSARRTPDNEIAWLAQKAWTRHVKQVEVHPSSFDRVKIDSNVALRARAVDAVIDSDVVLDQSLA